MVEHDVFILLRLLTCIDGKVERNQHEFSSRFCFERHEFDGHKAGAQRLGLRVTNFLENLTSRKTMTRNVDAMLSLQD